MRVSPLADAAGWVDVDPASLRHKTYANVFGLGDVTNTSNAKTAAAARKQAPVVANTLLVALGQLQGLTPHLMLVDIEMPRMDGFEFTRAVRASQQWRHIPIIIISSYVDEPHRATARAIGVDEYLGKPYEASELLAHVRALLSRALRASA